MKREQYDKDIYDARRPNGELAAARNDGRAEGHAEGLAQGHAEGKTEGQTEMARKRLTAGMEVGQVIQFTGLDRETVEKL